MKAIREELRSHTPNLSTSGPVCASASGSFGRVLLCLLCAGCWAWIGLSPDAKLSCAHFSTAKKVCKVSAQIATFLPDQKVSKLSEQILLSKGAYTYTTTVANKLSEFSLFCQLSAPIKTGVTHYFTNFYQIWITFWGVWPT